MLVASQLRYRNGKEVIVHKASSSRLALSTFMSPLTVTYLRLTDILHPVYLYSMTICSPLVKCAILNTSQVVLGQKTVSGGSSTKKFLVGSRQVLFQYLKMSAALFLY
jgi:hypothetical protein